jgi:hypothetical protein
MSWARRKDARDDISAGDEAGFLQGFARGDVVDVAAAGGDVSQFVGGALQFLNKERAEAAAAVGFGDGHEDVAVGAVVVIEEAAGGDDFAIEFQQKFGAIVELLSGDFANVAAGRAAENDVRLRERRGDFVVVEDGLGSDVFGVGVEHDVKENSVALSFDGNGVGGAEEGFEQVEDAQAMLGQNEKFEGGGFVFPWAGEGDGAVAGGFPVGEQQIRLSPAGAGVERIKHDLAAHFGTVELAQGGDLCKSGGCSGEVHGEVNNIYS